MPSSSSWPKATSSNVPHTLYEFWVVCTRPTGVNGMGRTAAEAVAELAALKALFRWLDETAAVFGAGSSSLARPRSWERPPTTPGSSLP